MLLATRTSVAKYFQKILFIPPMDTSNHPNQLIFPTLGAQRPPNATRAEVPTSSLVQEKFFGDYNAIDHSGNIYVYSISYCKSKKGAQHEFLMFHVRDKTDFTKENVIIVDRVPHDESTAPPPADAALAEGTANSVVEPATPETCMMSANRPAAKNSAISSGSFASINGTLPAKDRFVVSRFRSEKDLCIALKFDSFAKIEKLKVPHENLSVEHLIVVACAVSNHQPIYHLFRTQCYWYAAVVWEIIRVIAGPNATHELIGQGKGSKTITRLVKFTPSVAEADRPEWVLAKYHDAWKVFCHQVDSLKGRGAISERARAESERARADVAEAEIRKYKARIEELELKNAGGNKETEA